MGRERNNEMDNNSIHTAIKILKREVKKWEVPIVTKISKNDRSPFKVLISCILSLRTKDDVTRKASKRLFGFADNPSDMVKVSVKKIDANFMFFCPWLTYAGA